MDTEQTQDGHRTDTGWKQVGHRTDIMWTSCRNSGDKQGYEPRHCNPVKRMFPPLIVQVTFFTVSCRSGHDLGVAFSRLSSTFNQINDQTTS